VNARVALAVLQAVGALSLLVYPGVLAAVAMGMEAPATGWGDQVVQLLMYFLCAYPLVWIALWVGSWMAIRRGRTVLALLLSLPPALALVLGGAAVLVIGAVLAAAPPSP
jgi:hypothetical protein